MDFEVLKPVTLAAIIARHIKLGSIIEEDELKITRFSKRWPDHGPFDEVKQGHLYDLFEAQTWYAMWLADLGFISTPYKTADDLYEEWEINRGFCPQCGKEIDSMDYNFDETDVITQFDLRVEYQCCSCKCQWEDSFEWYDTEFHSLGKE